MRPGGLRAAANGNTDMPAGTAKWRDEDGVGIRRTQRPDVRYPAVLQKLERREEEQRDLR